MLGNSLRTTTSLVVLIGMAVFASASWAQTPNAKKAARLAAKLKEAEKVAPAQPMRPAPVTADKLDAAALARIIDQQVRQRLEAEKIPASPLADDAEFLRRVYLDLTGVIPSAEKAAAFLDSTDPDKRAKLIDELLADPRYGRFMAESWTSLLVPRESNNRRLQSEPLRDWLAEQFNANKHWDTLVNELLTATGPQDQNGAVTFFVGNPTPDKMTDTTTRLFLGVQLQCAQCHNHPFTGWKQTEYWGMAAFFMNVRLSANPNQAAKKGVAPSIIENNGPRKGKAKLPESAKIVPARFLQGEEPKMSSAEPYRPVLARWMTSPQNPFFARAMVNRTWLQLFGRGLVNPVDDMHDDNPASHPELLTALTDQFKASGFDVKHLIRAICNSQTYQRSSRTTGGNEEDNKLLSHAAVRVLRAEQLFDSLTQVLGQADNAAQRGKKAGGGKKGPGGPREQFLAFFHVDEGVNPLEYQVGIPQALRLMNSGLTNNTNPAVNQAVRAGNADRARVIDRLYLATLSRRPTAEELQRTSQYVARQTDASAGFRDVLWALINSSEFALNH